MIGKVWCALRRHHSLELRSVKHPRHGWILIWICKTCTKVTAWGK